MWVCYISVSSGSWEVEKRESLEAHSPDILAHEAAKSKGPHMKQGGEQGLTPEVVC